MEHKPHHPKYYYSDLEIVLNGLYPQSELWVWMGDSVLSEDLQCNLCMPAAKHFYKSKAEVYLFFNVKMCLFILSCAETTLGNH